MLNIMNKVRFHYALKKIPETRLKRSKSNVSEIR